MFEVARLLSKVYYDESFNIFSFEKLHVMKEKDIDLIIFDYNTSLLRIHFHDSHYYVQKSNYPLQQFDFCWKKIPSNIQDYEDDELLFILGKKYMDDNIFSNIDLSYVCKNHMIKSVKEFNSNV